jgi:hypothetical protein
MFTDLSAQTFRWNAFFGSTTGTPEKDAHLAGVDIVAGIMHFTFLALMAAGLLTLVQKRGRTAASLVSRRPDKLSDRRLQQRKSRGPLPATGKSRLARLAVVGSVIATQRSGRERRAVRESPPV